MMNKITLYLMLLTGSVAHAQISDKAKSSSIDSINGQKSIINFKSRHYLDLGVTISYFNKTKAPSNNPNVSEIFNRDVRTSISLGYRFQKPLTSSLFLITGLYYVERGASYKRENTSVNVTYTNVYGRTTSTEHGKDHLNYRLSYAELPINLGIKLNHNPKKHFLFVAGVSPMFNIVSKVRASYYDGPSNDLKQKWDQVDFNIAKKFLVAANAGVQIGNDKSYLLAMYNAPLTKVYDTGGGYQQFNVNMQSFTFSIALAFGK